QHRQSETHAPAVHGDRGAVCAREHEPGLPEVPESRVAELQVEPDGGERVDGCVDAEARTYTVAEDPRPIHRGSADPLALAEDALRTHQQHDDEYRERDRELQVGRQPIRSDL